MFTDTDSLLYEIETNVYEVFIWRKICLILVNIQVTQDFMMWKKKKLIDKVKGETKRVTIVEFVGLKSKIYSYIKKDNEED